MPISQIAYVGLGGMIGSCFRYLVSLFFQSDLPRFPFATLIVNVVGCFLIGAAASYASENGEPLSQGARLFFMTGILGGFTTFSAFGLETLQLIRSDQLSVALLNVGANLLLGLLAVWVGSLCLSR